MSPEEDRAAVISAFFRDGAPLSTTTEFSTLTTQGEVERLASSMLLDAASISPSGLASRANIDWAVARDILQAMVRNGRARALPSGRFAKPRAST